MPYIIEDLFRVKHFVVGSHPIFSREDPPSLHSFSSFHSFSLFATIQQIFSVFLYPTLFPFLTKHRAMGKDTMRAVVFKGPGKVVIEDRPIPKIKEPGDIIVKVDKVSIAIKHHTTKLS